jgi:hypothetical protein
VLRALVTMAALAVMVRAALAGEEPGWYRVELSSGSELTARLVMEDEEFYVLNFQGAVLRVEKSGVLKIERLSAPRAGPREADPAPEGRAGKAPPGPEPVPGADREGPPQPGEGAENEEALRDAVEALASTDDEEVTRSYRLLARDFKAGSPFLRLALSHQSPRVRNLAVKLLGEQGTAKDDLAAVSGRLADDRPEVRLAAIMAVRALGAAGFSKMAECLESETVPNNRKMAVKTFQRWRDRRAVAPLVERLAHEPDGGVRGFIAVALESLTGQKLGQDPEAWAAYLSEEEGRRGLEKLKQAAGLERGARNGEEAHGAEE